MTRSLRRTYTRRGKTTTATAYQLRLGKKTPRDPHGTVAPPSVDAFRRYVMAGICPFCGAGPYQVIATHVYRAHQISAKELRDQAGLYYSDSITAPEYRARKSETARALFAAGRTLRPEDVARGVRSPKRQLSVAARDLQREKGARSRELHPDLQRRMKEASMAATAERLRPDYERVVTTYEAVLAERGMAYGSVVETARRLGWPTATTLRRIEAAWALGLGHHERVTRSAPERRICPVCEEPYVVTRSRGWRKKTCSLACGTKLKGQRASKPPRTAICKICGNSFTYKRPGTAERKICDLDDCRREVMRRAGRRTPSVETRQRISAARKRSV